MKNNKFIRHILVLVALITLALLIKTNVTFQKENPNDKNSQNLEISSELVQNLYSKLTLLNDSIESDNYKNIYFKMLANEKELSNEEKLYIVIENMYQNDRFDFQETKNNSKKVVIKEEEIIEEVNNLFKGSDFDPKNINFLPSLDCGIVEYLYTGEEFSFTFSECDKSKEFTKSELKSAHKDGNFVVLRLKSYRALYRKKDKKNKVDSYIIKNHNGEEELMNIPKNDLYNRLSAIMEDDRIDEYDFYFELKGDDYYLSKIGLLRKLSSND